MINTLAKYKIFRVRQKISYHAFLKRMTISEIFLDQVKSTFDTFAHAGVIDLNSKDKKTLDEFEKLLSGNITKCLNIIVRINYKKVLERQRKEGMCCQQLDDFMKQDIEEQPSEVIQVKKGGKMVNVVVDPDLNQQKQAHVNMMLDKTKCHDIFNDVTIDKMPMYEQQSIKRQLKYKSKKSKLDLQMMKLKLIL